MTRGYSQSGRLFNGRKLYKTPEGVVKGLKAQGLGMAKVMQLPLSAGDYGFSYLAPGEGSFKLPLGSTLAGVYYDGRLRPKWFEDTYYRKVEEARTSG